MAYHWAIVKTILVESFEVEECARSEPLICRKWVDVSGRTVEVSVKELEEPVDTIFQDLQLLGVPFPVQSKVIYAAKSDGVPNTRDYGLAFSGTVRMEDSSFQSDLRIYDDGKEPVNVLYQFSLLNSAMVFLPNNHFGPSADL